MAASIRPSTAWVRSFASRSNSSAYRWSTSSVVTQTPMVVATTPIAKRPSPPSSGKIREAGKRDFNRFERVGRCVIG